MQLHDDDDAPVFRIVHKINERTQKTQVVPQIKVNNSQAIAITSNQGLLQNKIQKVDYINTRHTGLDIKEQNQFKCISTVGKLDPYKNQGALQVNFV